MAENKAKTPKTKKETPEIEDAITIPEVEGVVREKTEASTKGSTAKAGKRSAKAQEAAEIKAAKEQRKAEKAEQAEGESEAKPKKAVKPTRPKLDRRSKNYRESAKSIDKTKVYSLKEAVDIATKTSTVKFDATVEVHVNLNVDPRHADQNIRDNLVLPAGTGKTVRVAVFADDDTSSADVSGVENISKALEKGSIDFDILVATPANMPKLGKYARLLGPRGLMPNPKSGTVTNDISKAVDQARAGRVEYRVDSTGIVHMGIGKVSFKPADLEANAKAVFANIKGNKPASVKSSYVKAIYLTTTMGPSIKVAPAEL